MSQIAHHFIFIGGNLKKLISLVLLSAMAQSVFAANGNLLIGISPSSTAQGGTGVSGTTNVIDAIHKNPALVGAQKFGEGKVTAELMANIYKQAPTSDTGAGPTDSKGGVAILPSFAVAYQINPAWSFGIAGLAYGGGIADYSDLTNYKGIKTIHSLTKVQPAISYAPNEWLKVGLAPFLNYNSLVTNESLITATTTGRGANAQFGVGIMGGVGIQIVKGLDFGMSYTSKSTITHQNLINLALLGPGANAAAAAPQVYNSIKVDQPTEIAAGLGLSVTEKWRVALDWRYIGWQGAAGYSDLGWMDQHVIALGTQYKLEKLALRAGFNYAANPIGSDTNRNQASPPAFQGFVMNTASRDLLSLVAFPALAESHISVGAGYAVTDAIDLDLSLMYAPKVTVTRGGPALGAAAPAYSFTTSVTQWSVAVGGAYRF